MNTQYATQRPFNMKHATSILSDEEVLPIIAMIYLLVVTGESTIRMGNLKIIYAVNNINIYSYFTRHLRALNRANQIKLNTYN